MTHGCVRLADDDIEWLYENVPVGTKVYIYEDAGHGFNNDGRPGADPADARLARERTLALFEANGVG